MLVERENTFRLFELFFIIIISITGTCNFNNIIYNIVCNFYDLFKYKCLLYYYFAKNCITRNSPLIISICQGQFIYISFNKKNCSFYGEEIFVHNELNTFLKNSHLVERCMEKKEKTMMNFRKLHEIL